MKTENPKIINNLKISCKILMLAKRDIHIFGGSEIIQGDFPPYLPKFSHTSVVTDNNIIIKYGGYNNIM